MSMENSWFAKKKNLYDERRKIAMAIEPNGKIWFYVKEKGR